MLARGAGRITTERLLSERERKREVRGDESLKKKHNIKRIIIEI